MTQIKVDGILVDVPDHYTLMQAAEAAGAEIPRFCYHERLSVAGNCRMCLVEVKGGPPKPQASCAMAVRDVRGGPNGEPAEMFTNTPMVKKAREGVMEFLLINHPLDCPICDQAGECDLQDQAMAYGGDRARYKENKRAVEDKYIGPLVKTTMTRCIHCTRCVRFTTEVAGVSELGLIGRGEDAEITTYLEHALTSELQGNVIDLCPVGALTSRPYAFQARPWELTKTDSIDVMDAVGSNIRIDSRGREVLRILPRLHENVNEEWISDKARFSVDGLKAQRLDRPYIRKAGKLTQASWADALDAVAQGIRRTNKAKVAAIAGNLASVEDMFALKRLMQAIGVNNIDARPIGSALSHKNGRRSYLFNATIAGIEKADAILLIGSNPRHEAAVLNARIRKQWRNGAAQIAVIGEAADLTYSYDYLGSGAESLRALAAGKVAFSQVLKDAKFPLVIVGENVLSGENSEVNSSLINGLIGDLERENWLGYCVLHNAASRVGALDIAFEPLKGGKAMGEIIAGLANGDTEVLINMGNDEVQFERKSGSLVVYIGSHGDAGAHSADVILPAAAFSEKSGTYVNTEGRAQIANRAVFPPGHAKEDWAILRALAPLLNVELGFDTLNQLRVVLYQDYPHLARIDHIAADGELKISRTKPSSENVAGFYNIHSDFYLTNPIARASEVMAECSRGLSHNKQAAE